MHTIDGVEVLHRIRPTPTQQGCVMPLFREGPWLHNEQIDLTRVDESGSAMVDIPALIQALGPEERAEIQRLGPSGRLSADLIASIDRAAGGPGEGRGYYVYGEGAGGERSLKLTGDVAAAIFGTVA